MVLESEYKAKESMNQLKEIIIQSIKRNNQQFNPEGKI